MRSEIDAVAFDLDGTLYPNYRFYIRLGPFILRHHRLMLAMGKARKIIRDPLLTAPSDIAAPKPGYFYDLQARFMAAYLKKEPVLVKEETDRFIYRGWEELFRKIKLFPRVKETLVALKEGGLKLALLSDFPPKQKLDYLGLSGFWDTVICSEDTGRLKPDIVPFRALAEELALPPGRILYVGNSVSYDIIGARKAGMKAALVSSPLLRIIRKNRRHNGNADFIFTGYRQLSDYVLH